MGRLTERGRPGAAKERVDTVRKNKRVCYFVQASDVHVLMYSCTDVCTHVLMERSYWSIPSGILTAHTE